MFKPILISTCNSASRIIALTIICLVLAINSLAQGFGIRKIKSSFTLKTPPAVYLPTGTFSVEVQSQKRINSDALIQLRNGIEIGLGRSDPRLRAVSDNAETVIACAITDVDVASRWQTRYRSEYQATGAHTVHNETTQANETVTDYGWVNVAYRAFVVNGRMAVVCEITDRKSGFKLDSHKITASYSQDFDSVASAPDAETAQEYLAREAASQIIARLVEHKEAVPVLLPKGKLKQWSELFNEGLWNQALDVIEAMPTFKNPKDDAYRLYSLAVMHEAIAYVSDDLATTMMHLERAAESYNRATELKPKEDQFWEPRRRAQDELGLYRRLAEQASALEASRRASSQQAARVTPPAQTPSGQSQAQRVSASMDFLTNDTIINWVKTGLSEDYILAAIAHSRATQFDLSPPELLKLKQAGVSSRIIRAMQSPQMLKRRGPSGWRLAASLLTLWPYWVLLF